MNKLIDLGRFTSITSPSVRYIVTRLLHSSNVILYSPVRESSSKDIDGFGAWDSTTDMPLLVDASITHGKPIPKVRLESIGVSSVKGRRMYQEDFTKVKELMPGLLYIGLFDGHGGASCSKFCSENLHHHISYWLESHHPEGKPDLIAILHKSILEVNNAYSRWFTCEGQGRDLDLVSPGTTATVCLLHNSMQLLIGHVGDSRAILCRGGDARKLTTDHIPELRTEKIRIEQSGGKIINQRVNGRLAMTRSLGDLEFKKFGVTAHPEVRTTRISHSRDAFLVLTTDGINSVMTDQEIADAVKQAEDPTESAHLLTDTSLQYSSEDNSTAIVVPLGSWGKYTKSATIFHSFGKSFTSSSRFG